MATIKDIARLSGYSVGTVSRVINNHPDVNENTRMKIEKVIEETNFQPNSNAKLLKQQAPSPITIFVKGTNNVFLDGILEEMQLLFKQHDEEIVVVFLNEKDNELDNAINVCKERNPKGLIFLGGNITYFKKDFKKIKVPSVLVTESAEDLHYQNLSSFSTNDAMASQSAMEYLVSRGHRNIAIVGGEDKPDKGEVGYRRYKNAVTYLKENNLPFDSSLQFEPSGFSTKEGYEATIKLLNKNKNITAIYAMSDLIAMGCKRAVVDKGLNVPDDISIIGFDGIEMTKYSVPRITSIEQDTKELAKRSVEDLLLRINYEKHPSQHNMIPYHIYVGESVKAIKQ